MNMEAVMGVLLGIGLGAACGFRIFVPLLVASIGVVVLSRRPSGK